MQVPCRYNISRNVHSGLPRPSKFYPTYKCSRYPGILAWDPQLKSKQLDQKVQLANVHKAGNYIHENIPPIYIRSFVALVFLVLGIVFKVLTFAENQWVLIKQYNCERTKTKSVGLLIILINSFLSRIHKSLKINWRIWFSQINSAKWINF